jgi:hypothetical protein
VCITAVVGGIVSAVSALIEVPDSYRTSAFLLIAVGIPIVFRRWFNNTIDTVCRYIKE